MRVFLVFSASLATMALASQSIADNADAARSQCLLQTGVTPAKPVALALSTGPAQTKASEVIDEEVLSARSGTGDDEPTTASCPAGSTLTGCSCYSPWASCDGAKANGRTCTAYNKHRGNGVYAQAVCRIIPGVLNSEEVLSAISGKGDDEITRASCPAGTTLTGCSCYSPWASCDGAKHHGQTCTAYNKHGGKGVYAQAVCRTIPGASNFQEVLSARSGTGDDEPTTASCPAGKSLTGCTCYSPWASCDGAKAKGHTCTAYNKHGGKGVSAQARCGTIPEVQPTPQPTPPTQAPTPAPTPAPITVQWIKGGDGQTCNAVCGEVGKVCNRAKQSSLTTNDLVAEAFDKAGYTCKSFHAARDYAGTPFSTGRSSDDCVPILAGSTSSCTENKLSHHAPLCACEQGMFHWTCVRQLDACYGRGPAGLSEADARDFCGDYGGTLASVSSALENSHVSGVCGSSTWCWLGLTDAGFQGAWTWNDGTPFVYENWGNNEGVGGRNNNCVGLAPDEKWVDTPCAGIMKPLCKKTS